LSINILLIEDNAGDARLFSEGLLEANKTVHLEVVTDGVEAMQYLKYQGKYLQVPRPDLILLDLNMPKMDGLEVLAGVKSDPRLKTIPIIVLTTSESEMDILRSYSLFASCYLTKPKELREYERLVKSLNDFWLTSVKFKKQPHPVPTA
jgi:chemotaxis family two-component system response regulator Rcp1